MADRDDLEEKLRKQFIEYVLKRETVVAVNRPHLLYRASVGEIYLCPCCRLPTLPERGGYFICTVCWWEDDGQDDPFADEVWGMGPNHGYSLTEARINFAAHLTMYRLPDDGSPPRFRGDERQVAAKLRMIELATALLAEPEGEVAADLWAQFDAAEAELTSHLPPKTTP